MPLLLAHRSDAAAAFGAHRVIPNAGLAAALMPMTVLTHRVIQMPV